MGGGLRMWRFLGGFSEEVTLKLRDLGSEANQTGPGGRAGWVGWMVKEVK